MSIGVARKHISRQKACLYQVYVIISRAFIRKEITLTPTRAVRDMVISCLKPSYLSKQILIGGPGLYHLKAGCLECVMGGSVFPHPSKFRRDRSLKTAQNHKFQFLKRHKSKSFGLRNALPIP